MKKQFLFILLIICSFTCYAQGNSDPKYKTLIARGDSAWKKNNIEEAKDLYYEASTYKVSSPEIIYRLDNLNKKYLLRWNDSVNRFFKYLELGDYCNKDKCYMAARSCYEKALAIAAKKEYKYLNHSVHTKYAKKKIKAINKWVK